MSKTFIWFFCLLILAFFLPTHPWVETFFQPEIFPGISRAYFIISLIGLLGLILVYFTALYEKSQLKKQIKNLQLSKPAEPKERPKVMIEDKE